MASVIFGVFLNRNLKRSHDEEDPWTGISYIVAIVFFLALVGFTTWYEGIPHIIANGDGTYKMTQPAANSTQDSSSSTAHQSQENTLQRLTIPGTNSQITISGEWKYLTRNNSDKSLNDGLVLIPPSTGKYAGLLVYATDMSQYVNEYINQYGENPNVEIIDKDAVLGQNSVTINSLQNETAELVEINGIEFWKAQARIRTLSEKAYRIFASSVPTCTNTPCSPPMNPTRRTKFSPPTWSKSSQAPATNKTSKGLM